MKHFILAMLAVALISLPVGAIAGEPSAPEMGFGMSQKLQLTPVQMQACTQLMTQAHQQLQQLHQQARAKILGSLSPAHRALLAQVVGSMAIAVNPDEQGAVRQLNAALSPGEAQAVVGTHTAFEQQAESIFTSIHQRMSAILTPQQRAQMPTHEAGSNRMPEPSEMNEKQPTAGEILLDLSSEGGDGGGHHMKIMMMHP